MALSPDIIPPLWHQASGKALPGALPNILDKTFARFPCNNVPGALTTVDLWSSSARIVVFPSPCAAHRTWRLVPPSAAREQMAAPVSVAISVGQ